MNKVVETSLKYVGEKELNGNVFDPNSDFGKKLHSVGQKDGESWCAYFTEMVFKEAFPAKAAELDKLFSASAVQTFKNFTHPIKGKGYSQNHIPAVGNLVIWQKYVNGQPTWQGHAGIVSKVISTWEFESIEGNTNEAGSREGNTVAIKQRKVLAKVDNGLKVLGFIQI